MQISGKGELQAGGIANATALRQGWDVQGTARRSSVAAAKQE